MFECVYFWMVFFVCEMGMKVGSGCGVVFPVDMCGWILGGRDMLS